MYWTSHVIYHLVLIEIPGTFYDAYNGILWIRVSYQCHKILFFHVSWAQKLHHHILKRGQLSIDLYLNIIKLDTWILFILFFQITS